MNASQTRSIALRATSLLASAAITILIVGSQLGIGTPVGPPVGRDARLGFATASADPPTASICLYDALAQLREVPDGRAQRHQRTHPPCQRG